MKKTVPHLLALVVIFACTISAPAQTMTPARGADNTRPSYDMKGQSLLDLKVMQKKLWISPRSFRKTSSVGVPRRIPARMRRFCCTLRESVTGFWL